MTVLNKKAQKDHSTKFKGKKLKRPIIEADKYLTLDQFADVKNTLNLFKSLSTVEMPTSNIKLQISEIGLFNNHIIRCIIINGLKCLTISDIAKNCGVEYHTAFKSFSTGCKKGGFPYTEGYHFIIVSKTEFEPLKDVVTKGDDVSKWLREVLSSPGKEVTLLTPRGAFRMSASFRTETKDAWMEWLARFFENAINAGDFNQRLEAFYAEKYNAPPEQIGDPAKNYRLCTGEIVDSRAEQNIAKALLANHVHYQPSAHIHLIYNKDFINAGLTIEEVRDAWGYIPEKIEPDFFFLNITPLTILEYWGGMNDPRFPNYRKIRCCKEKIYATLQPNPFRLISIEPEEANSILGLIEKIKGVLNGQKRLKSFNINEHS